MLVNLFKIWVTSSYFWIKAQGRWCSCTISLGNYSCQVINGIKRLVND